MKLNQLACVIYSMAALLMWSACSVHKHLPEDAKVLRSNKVILQTDRGISEKGILKDQVAQLLIQKPNTYLLNIPYKVWLYQLQYNRYKNSTNNHQIRNNIVEAPVIFDSAASQQSIENIHNFLVNQGYFNASTQYDYKVNSNQNVKVIYQINTGNSHNIQEVHYHSTNPFIQPDLQDIKSQTLLTTGTRYSHTLVGQERIRIVNAMRNKGFYKFGTNNISFEIDTTFKPAALKKPQVFNNSKSEKPVGVDVIFHSSRDTNAYQVYAFDKVVVFPDFVDSIDVNLHAQDGRMLNGLMFKFNKEFINPSVLDKKITIRPGQHYSQTDYDYTLRQLSDLGIFEYVRILITPSTKGPHLLNCFILLNPAPKYDFSTNVEVSGGDIYVLGSAANIAITDKNFLKGANQLTLTGSFGIELGQDKSNPDANFVDQLYLFSQNSGVNFNLSFPKFILPFHLPNKQKYLTTHTFIDGGINTLKRREYFSLQSTALGIGYRWRPKKTKQWTVKPLFVNNLNLSNISDVFKARMDSIPAIKNSYQEVFIEGENGEFLYNTEGINPKKHSWIKVGVEEAGLLMRGVNGLYQSFQKDNTKLGYAEYIRFDFDFRQYYNLSKSKIALRFYGGIGLPYGTATTLPYIKQYFVGGAYSIRGWRPRVLGPGSYFDANSQNAKDKLFIDQAGDIKLELNAEYRFAVITLFSGAISINGAFFADAGNIWLAREDKALPGAHFELKNLYREMAMSYGAGLRFDLGGFLVVRLDYALQGKKPHIRDNDGWTFASTHLGSKMWRQENTNINIAIGYPF